MTRAAPTVLADALRLDPRSRTELAAELPGSIEGPSEPGAAAAWDAEIRGRVAAVEGGTENPEPREEVRRRIGRAILRR